MLLYNFIGLFTYIILFVILIPYNIYNSGFILLFESYIVNFDLIANLLTFKGNKYFKNLYQTLYIQSNYQFLSATFINFLTLLSITYLIARETKRTKNIIKGWSSGFLVILITYLLPSNYIMKFMNSSFNFFKLKYSYNEFYAYILSLSIGIIITISIIILERILIKLNQNSINKLLNIFI